MKRACMWISISLCLWSAQLIAADYPAGQIKANLENAKHPVEVDLSNLKAGELKIVQYAERPIWIYRRSEADLKYLRSGYQSHLANPESEGFFRVIEDQYSNSRSEVWVRLLAVSQPRLEKERFRSLTGGFLVVAGHSPLGCSLKKLPRELRRHTAAPFLDVCAGTWFDVAGRLLKSEWTPPPARAKELAGGNLLIPPHYFKSPSKLVIGLRPSESIPEVDLAAIRERFYARLRPAERLAFAAGYNDIEEVRRGLETGAYAQVGPSSPNPLDGAIVGGSLEIINLLLSHGVRPTKNSREIAELVERTAVIKLLEPFEDTPTKSH